MWFYEVMVILCAGSSLTLAGVIWSKRPPKGGTALAALFLCMGWSAFSYSMDLGSTDLDFSVFWNRAGLLGEIFITPLMLMLAQIIIRPARKPHTGLITGTMLAGTAILLLSWTNDWHHLYFSRVWIDTDSPIPVLAKARGPLFPVFFIFIYWFVLVALAQVARALLRSKRGFRTQHWLLFFAYLFPLVFHLPYALHLLPGTYYHLNIMLIGFFISTILLAVALFRFKLISPIPLDESERNELLLRYAHAFLFTISENEVITYITPNCEQLTGYTQTETIGADYTAHAAPEDHPTCRAFFRKVARTRLPQTGLEHRIIKKDGSVCWYATSIVPVNDRNGKLISYVGAAHDITKLKETQRSLDDSNRELSALIERRENELRTAMNEALTAAEGEARRIGENIHDGLCHDLICLARLTETARSTGGTEILNEIQQLANKLTNTARIYSHDLALYELDMQSLPEAIDSLAHRAEQFFDVSVEVNTGRSLPALSAEKTNHIYRIVREAIANANRHAKARHIWVDIIHEDRQIIVSITNDGLPIPDSCLAGLGTKQIQMRTRLLGGSFSLTRQPGDETVAELIIPTSGKEPVCASAANKFLSSTTTP